MDRESAWARWSGGAQDVEGRRTIDGPGKKSTGGDCGQKVSKECSIAGQGIAEEETKLKREDRTDAPGRSRRAADMRAPKREEADETGGRRRQSQSTRTRVARLACGSR